MKFGNLLRAGADEVPDLEPLWACYKQLKKHLKRFPKTSTPQASGAATAQLPSEPAPEPALGATVPSDQQHMATALVMANELRQQEQEFVTTLSSDVAQFNDTFCEKEETCVIRLRELQDQAQAAAGPGAGKAQQEAVYKQLVDFHGELLLLLHWSILAYTAVVKILKKHHKRTGLLVDAPDFSNLINQPFCSVEVMTDMVRNAEIEVAKMAKVLGVPYESRCEARRLGKLPGTQSTAMSVGENMLAAALEQDGAWSGAHELGGDAQPAVAGVRDCCPCAAASGGESGRKRAREECSGGGGTGTAVEPSADTSATQGSSIFRQTRAALGLWHQLGSTAATPSTVYPAQAELVARNHSATSHNSGA